MIKVSNCIQMVQSIKINAFYDDLDEHKNFENFTFLKIAKVFAPYKLPKELEIFSVSKKLQKCIISIDQMIWHGFGFAIIENGCDLRKLCPLDRGRFVLKFI